MSRWWGIRHMRYWWYRRQVYQFAKTMAELGLGLGLPNPSDLSHLNRIWRGEA